MSGSDPVDPAVAPYLALVSTLPAETGIKTRLLDMGHQPGEEAWAHHLIPVLRASFGPALGAVRGTRWWVPAPIDVTAPAAPPAPARVERPVVLVTGGLGGVGSHLARYLAEARGARLALVSRRGADPRATAERLGTADLMVIEADITEDGAAHAILERAVARFGRVDMVVHAAAVPFGAMLEVRDGNRAEQIHAVKMRAAVALAEAAEQVPGVADDAVLVLISSKANTGGAVGSFDYLAANFFLDAYAQRGAARIGIRTASVAWDRWRGIGMARELERRHHERTGEWLADGMPAAAAARAFGRCLDLIATGERHLVVSAHAQVIRHEHTARIEPEPTPQSQPHPRAGRLGPQVPPRTGLEEALVTIWEKALRMDSIGVTDNFFELGGDSLIGMQIIRSLRSSHGQRMSVGLLFRHPTVRALATALEAETVAEPRVSRSARRTVGDYLKEAT